jgi:hypothetical protein
VLQEARTFNDTPVNAKKCIHILTKILYLLNQVNLTIFKDPEHPDNVNLLLGRTIGDERSHRMLFRHDKAVPVERHRLEANGLSRH